MIPAFSSLRRRIQQGGEREAPIDDRSNADYVETAHHVLLTPTGTDDQSLQALCADDGARG